MGNKYLKAAEKIENEQDFNEKQKVLRKKYDVPEGIIIKEKNNMIKFTVNTIRGFIRIIATIALIILAAIGLMASIYPEPRREIISILIKIYEDIISFVN